MTRLQPGEFVRGADQAIEDAWLAEQMAAVGNDVELDFGPRLLELPCGDRRGAGVMAALDDDARNPAQLRRRSWRSWPSSNQPLFAM